jgi:hypothetical protein
MRDGGWKVYPQGYNAVKYLLSIVVVVIGLQASSNVALYFFFIALSTFYKWWWDVVMDWGLFDVLPKNVYELLDLYNYRSRKMFLRKSLMYPRENFYYLCIVIDLILRFLWVLSTLPPDSLHGLVGYQLSFFLGSMEIIRRCMWGILRVEYEHLKMLKNKTPGYLSNHVLRMHEHPELIGNHGEDGMDGYDSDDDPSKQLQKIKDKKKKHKQEAGANERFFRRFNSQNGPKERNNRSLQSFRNDNKRSFSTSMSHAVEMFRGSIRSDHHEQNKNPVSSIQNDNKVLKNKTKNGLILDDEASSSDVVTKNPMVSHSK